MRIKKIIFMLSCSLFVTGIVPEKGFATIEALKAKLNLGQMLGGGTPQQGFNARVNNGQNAGAQNQAPKAQSFLEILQSIILGQDGMPLKSNGVLTIKDISRAELFNLLTARSWKYSSYQSRYNNALPFQSNRGPTDKELYVIIAAIDFLKNFKSKGIQSLNEQYAEIQDFDKLWRLLANQSVNIDGNTATMAGSSRAFQNQIRRYVMIANRNNENALNSMNLSENDRAFLRHVDEVWSSHPFAAEIKAENEKIIAGFADKAKEMVQTDAEDFNFNTLKDNYPQNLHKKVKNWYDEMFGENPTIRTIKNKLGITGSAAQSDAVPQGVNPIEWQTWINGGRNGPPPPPPPPTK